MTNTSDKYNQVVDQIREQCMMIYQSKGNIIISLELIKHFGFDPPETEYSYTPLDSAYWCMYFVDQGIRVLFSEDKKYLKETSEDCTVMNILDQDDIKVSKTGKTMVKYNNSYIVFDNLNFIHSKS